MRRPYVGAAIVRGSLLFLAVTGLLFAIEGIACAQPNRTWTGLGADSQWTTAENWDPVGVPHPNLGDTQYTMASTTRLDPTVSQIYVINKITYDNTAGARSPSPIRPPSGWAMAASSITARARKPSTPW